MMMNPGVDSFYEYLLKAHILFGGNEYWEMFQSAYIAVQKYFRHGPWLVNNLHVFVIVLDILFHWFDSPSFFLGSNGRYHESDMRTGKATYWQLTSLQAFWPGIQVG
jgi:mannosidase alpha-like ER degradation enhancer 1